MSYILSYAWSCHTKTFQILREMNQQYDSKVKWNFIQHIKRYECLNFIFQNLNLRTFQRFLKQIMLTFYMTLSLILLWRKFSWVLFAYLIKEDVLNPLLLLARKPWGTGMILWSRVAVSTLGRSHLVLIDRGVKIIGAYIPSRCSAGTTSSACYLKQRLLYVWAEWSKDHWRPNVNDQASKPQRTP